MDNYQLSKMDVTQALKDVENSLRDFLAAILQEKFNGDWIVQSGLSVEKINKCIERQEVDRKKFGTADERLIYYTDFYDLVKIIEKHWDGPLKDALGDLPTIRVWLKNMNDLRDPDAHRRELFPYQKHLILGISGEIRTKIIRYRSKMETSEDFYPRFEIVRDSLGNSIGAGNDFCKPENKLRIGDEITFIITATDPLGEEVEFRLWIQRPETMGEWQKSNVINWVIGPESYGPAFGVMIQLRSTRDVRARVDYDQHVVFHYEILPIKR